jgi:hypothetical protein
MRACTKAHMLTCTPLHLPACLRKSACTQGHSKASTHTIAWTLAHTLTQHARAYRRTHPSNYAHTHMHLPTHVCGYPLTNTRAADCIQAQAHTATSLYAPLCMHACKHTCTHILQVLCLPAAYVQFTDKLHAAVPRHIDARAQALEYFEEAHKCL